MAVINDATILTFEFLPGEPEIIKPKAISEIVGAFETAFSQVMEPFFLGASAQMFLAESPTRGSLKFFFAVEVSYTQEKAKRLIAPAAGALGDLADKATVAAFLWMVFLGGRGIFDLYSHPDAQPLAGNDPRIEAVAREILNSQKNTQRANGLALIRASAKQAGAIRVTIQIPGEPPVDVWVGTDRLSSDVFTKLAAKKQSPLTQGAIVRESQAIPVKFRGQRYDSFLASLHRPSSQERVVVVWGSQLPIPNQNNQAQPTHVSMVGIQPQDLVRPLEKVPDGWDHASVLFFVEKAAEFK